MQKENDTHSNFCDDDKSKQNALAFEGRIFDSEHSIKQGNVTRISSSSSVKFISHTSNSSRTGQFSASTEMDIIHSLIVKEVNFVHSFL